MLFIPQDSSWIELEFKLVFLSFQLIRKFDLSKGAEQEADILQGHTSAVKYIVCLDDDKTLLSVGDDKVLKVWDLANNECVDTIQLSEAAQSMQLSPDGMFHIVLESVVISLRQMM